MIPHVGPPHPFPTMSISIQGALAAATAFKEARNGNVAPTDEIAVRANICEACPKRRNIRVHGTDQASRVMGMMANKNRVPPVLKNSKCGVCQCSLMLLVPSRGEFLHRDSPAEAADRAANAPRCWVPAAIKASAQPPTA